MLDYEKLGVFYLGRQEGGAGAPEQAEPLLYPSRDLTTHGVCVGMTGSGKTGLCISLLEEAAIDGIPALIIDPKGDMGNLLLGFPELEPADFLPWIDPAEAARKGRSPEDHAAQVAQTWRRGLADWGQDGDRIRRLQAAAEAAIYTPGSRAGRPLSLLRSLDAPPPAQREDPEALLQRVETAASGILALLGVAADPLQSREHILLANLLQHAWLRGENLDVPELVRRIQAPPFAQLGVLDLEAFYPSRERFALAMRLNNLLASPGFQVWLEGEPLALERLLYTPQGRPRLAIVSIAHLSDRERMFVVTTLLNEVLGWMRGLAGTSSLRALIYMDEVFGYLPPVAEPPSKKPLLTLLKQARAFGLGVLLATQNPVDLDYKALSNAGTWFLGRLQTERDRARVLDGLEGASGGQGFDRQQMDQILSGLESRRFLLHDVHAAGPQVFQTRWALSYLRGPLTKAQIEILEAPQRAAAAAATAAPPTLAPPSLGEEPAAPSPAPAAQPSEPRRQPTPLAAGPDDRTEGAPPILPAEIPSGFLPVENRLLQGARLQYRPALLVEAHLHYQKARPAVDHWEDLLLLLALPAGQDAPDWDRALSLAGPPPDLEPQPLPEGRCLPLPAAARRPASYRQWSKALAQQLYRSRRLSLWSSPDVGLSSEPGEPELDFRLRVAQALREARDAEAERLRQRYGPKLQALQEKVLRAQEKLEREQGQLYERGADAALRLGGGVLGAFLGNKLLSARNLSRAGQTARAAQRVQRESADVDQARAQLERMQEALSQLEVRFRAEVDALRTGTDPASAPLGTTELAPRKGDIDVGPLRLVWIPWAQPPEGKPRLAWARPPASRSAR